MKDKGSLAAAVKGSQNATTQTTEQQQQKNKTGRKDPISLHKLLLFVKSPNITCNNETEK